MEVAQSENVEINLKECKDVLVYWAVNGTILDKLQEVTKEFAGLVERFTTLSSGMSTAIFFFARRLMTRKRDNVNRALNIMQAFNDWHEQFRSAKRVYSEIKEEMRGFLDFDRPDVLYKDGMDMKMMRDHLQADQRFANLESIKVDEIEKSWNDLNLDAQMRECITELEAMHAEIPIDSRWSSLLTGVN